MGGHGAGLAREFLPLGEGRPMFGKGKSDQCCVLDREIRSRNQPVVTETVEHPKVGRPERLEAAPSIAKALQILITQQHQLDLITGQEAGEPPGMGCSCDAGTAIRQFSRKHLGNPFAKLISRRIRLVRTDQKMLSPVDIPLPIRRMPAGQQPDA